MKKAKAEVEAKVKMTGADEKMCGLNELCYSKVVYEQQMCMIFTCSLEADRT